MPQPTGASMPTLDRLDQLAELVERAEPERRLYVRWSRGPDADAEGGDQSSRDSLTGVPLPGLSANSLHVEDWWGDRSVRLWVARRLYDYRHLQELRGPGVRPWVLEGVETGRGPDNEPLVKCRRPIAWIGEAALGEVDRIVMEQQVAEWGPLDRR